MIRTLITGGAGFLGSHVIDSLLALDHDVIVLDDLSGGFKENINAEATLIEGSITDVKLLAEIFKSHQIDYIFHLAAFAAEGLSHFIRRYNYTNNLIGSVNLINAAVNHGRVKCFVFTSSIAVYGTNQVPFLESTVPEPEDCYGIAKHAVECDLRAAKRMFGLDSIIFRPHNCYDDKTEILTKDGFRLFRELTDEDEVATLNPKTETLEYHRPTARQSIPYSGKLYNFFARKHDLCVTPDHKMWIKASPRGEWKFETAQELTNRPTAYYTKLSRHAKWTGGSPEYFDIPEVKDSRGRPMTNAHQNGHARKILAPDWAEFIGWYVAEGCRFKTKMNYVVVISQSRSANPEKYAEIVSLVKRMGFSPYTGSDKEIRIFSKQLFAVLEDCGHHARGKNIPPYIKLWSAELLNVLFDSIMKGDGSKDKRTYSTVSDQLADDMCEISLKTGRSASVSVEDNEHGGIYRVYICAGDEPQLGNDKSDGVSVSEVDYSGTVYDVTVTNHIIFVRRNGKGCWSSNCYGERQNLGDPYRNVVGIFMNQVMQKQPLTIFGDGTQTRAFTHVADVAPLIANSVNVPNAYNRTFNVGADIPYSVNRLAEAVQQAMGANGPITHLDKREEVLHAFSGHAMCDFVFGKTPKITLEDGLARTAAWAKQHGSRKGKPFAAIEIEKNMPPCWRQLSWHGAPLP